MIETVLLDLDDTILDFHKAEAIALRRALTEMDVSVTDAICERYSEINAAQWRALEAGEITRKQVLTRRFELLYAELGVMRSPEETQRRYEGYLSQGHYFIPGAEELLEALFPRCALYLVSNGNAVVQEGRLKSANISRYFREIFISEHIGADKPSRVYFDRCFARIPGFRRETAILVGDSLTSDIRGGINAGVRTCWFNPRHKPKNPDIPADYEIDALSDLPPLLERI